MWKLWLICLTELRNRTPGTQLSEFVRHLNMDDCRPNSTPLVNLQVIHRTHNVEQIFSCWLIIILWQVQSKNRKEINYQVQAVLWKATNAAKNLHILACKLDLQYLNLQHCIIYVYFFHECLVSLLSACLQQLHDCIFSTC